MLSIITFVLFSTNILIKASQHLNSIEFDENLLQSLKISNDQLPVLGSYQEFELLNEYQCAIECIRHRSTCNGYTFNSTIRLCSLFDYPMRTVDDTIKNIRKQFYDDPCDKMECNPGAICVEGDEPTCVCINGNSTPDNCDYIEQNVWGDFDDWSECSVTCGEGFQYRKRKCMSQTNKNQILPREYCIGSDTEIQVCNVTKCPIYGSWSSWTPCSTFCGIGVKQRNRSCVPSGSNCGDYTFEQRACGEAVCQRVAGIKETESEKYPMKGYLSVREGDIICISNNDSVTAKYMADLVCKSIGLNRGAQYAVLNSIRDNASCYQGIVCDGTEKTFYDCKYDRLKITKNTQSLYAIITRCIVDGGFAPWSEWSPCSQTCGGGQSTRLRTCTEPSPTQLEPETSLTDKEFAGANCTGEYKQFKTCNQHKC